MPVNIRGRHFLTLLDYTPAEIRYLLEVSREFKRMKYNGVPHRYLEGKNIVLLFEKTSTRTRCAFEVAGHDLGMGVTYLDPGSSQMGKKESIADTARVLGRMYDGIEYRGFDQKLVEELARYAGVPVWNGLTDQFHPTQMLADLLTMEEKFGSLKGLRFTYMGDARNNMGNSLMVACAKMGIHFTACAPRELFPAAGLVETARAIAAENHGSVRLTENVDEGAKDADIVYTDIWVSMGSRTRCGIPASGFSSPIRSTPPSWTEPGRTPFSCTACPPSTTPGPPSGPRSPKSSASGRWRSPTRCSNPASRWCSMRRRTGCTPLRRLCTPRFAENSINRSEIPLFV